MLLSSCTHYTALAHSYFFQICVHLRFIIKRENKRNKYWRGKGLSRKIIFHLYAGRIVSPIGAKDSSLTLLFTRKFSIWEKLFQKLSRWDNILLIKICLYTSTNVIPNMRWGSIFRSIFRSEFDDLTFKFTSNLLSLWIKVFLSNVEVYFKLTNN